jgi:hypothetical protein
MSSQISNVSVNQGRVYLNDRVEHGNEVNWEIPKGKVFIITDIIVQNRAPGDIPVQQTDFTRFSITSPSGQDTFFTVVGNDTLSEHFITGLCVIDNFRFYNLPNSSASFAEFVITGLLQNKIPTNK